MNTRLDYTDGVQSGIKRQEQKRSVFNFAKQIARKEVKTANPSPSRATLDSLQKAEKVSMKNAPSFKMDTITARDNSMFFITETLNLKEGEIRNG